MHPIVLIPLLSALAAGTLAGAIWARDPANRGNRLATAILACLAFWSTCDVFSNLAGSPETALWFIRASCIGSLSIAPLAFHMLLVLQPRLAPGFARLLPLAYAQAAISIAIALTTNALWSGVEPAPWGHGGVIGHGVLLCWALALPLPVAALVGWYRLADAARRTDLRIGVGVAIPVLIATLTDFVLPYLGVQVPRLGGPALVTWGGVALWRTYRFRNPILAPHLFAREILATLPDGVTLLRLDGTIRTANGAFADLVGSTAERLQGRPISEILTDVDFETQSARREGERSLLRDDGERIAVFADEAPLLDDAGDALGRVIVVRDLRELVSLRSRLVTSGRLVAVGQLAAGIAHEINNPIAYVQSNLNRFETHWQTLAAEFAKHAPDAPEVACFEDGSEMIHEVRDGLRRVAAIVRDVGGFSRQTNPAPERANVNELLDSVLRVASPQLGGVSVVTQYATLPLIPCLPQELMQVFLNLILNAAQAVTTAGRIRIETQLLGDLVEIRLKDNGMGMSPETRKQIFTPFFTTKAVGKGTGLGLSISLQIIEKHAGSIEVESAPGAGTTFAIRLPVGEDSAREGAPA